MKNLQNIKGKLRGWSKDVFGNIEEAKSKIILDLEILDRMEEERDLNQLEWD